MLIRDKMLYLAWLGDSQACLVRDGHALCIMNPHKPERQVDRLGVKYTSPLIYKNTKYVNDKFTLFENIWVSKVKFIFQLFI